MSFSPVDDDAFDDMERVLAGWIEKMERADDDADDADKVDLEKINLNDFPVGYLDAEFLLEMKKIISPNDVPMTPVDDAVHNLFSDLKLPCDRYLLYPTLEAMAATFASRDFSVLQKYCRIPMDSSSTENLSVKEAVEHDVAAICVFFLYSKECRLNIKEGLASALRFIIYNKQESVVDAQGMSIDQESIDTLVVDALRSGDGDIISQVCAAIDLVVDLRLTSTVSTGIQNQLVQLARSSQFNAWVAIPLFQSINTINSKIEDTFMREKLVDAVLSDRKWLVNSIKSCHLDLVLQAYKILQGIALGKYDDELWEALVHEIIPEILKRDDVNEASLDLHCLTIVICASEIISNIVKRASSPDQIRFLAFETECVRVLVGCLDRLDGDGTCVCMEAIERLLKADDNDSEANKLARMIGKNRFLHVYGNFPYEREARVKGWTLLDNHAPNSERILSTYAPRKWLRKREIEREERAW